MRILQNLAKFALLVCLALSALALTAFVGLMNYQGLVSGIELLNLENKPLGADNLIGWVFESLTPDATFSNCLALVITALIFMGSLFVCHQIFKIVKLALNRNEYRRLGQSEQMGQAIAQEATWLLLLGVPLCLVAWGDIYLFQYRALAGAMNIANPEDAVTLLHWSKLPTDVTEAASVMFLKSVGMYMYLGCALLAPFSLEYLVTKMSTTWTAIETAWHEQFASKTPNGGEQAVQQFFGYDAQGNPVYDPNTPIAYDVNQNPVDTASPPRDSTAPQKPAAEAPEQALKPAGNDARDARFPVIGAQPQENLTLAEALAHTDRYHVEKATRSIYARAYWDALQGQHPDTNWTTTKEAA